MFAVFSILVSTPLEPQQGGFSVESGTNKPSGQATTHLDRLYTIHFGWSKETDNTQACIPPLIVIQISRDNTQSKGGGALGI